MGKMYAIYIHQQQQFIILVNVNEWVWNDGALIKIRCYFLTRCTDPPHLFYA